MLLTNILKFVHLLLTLGLLSSTIYCVTQVVSKQWSLADGIMLRMHKGILVQIVLVAITGTFLVYPKGFTFHTPWIQAAYIFITLFTLGILSLIFFRKKIKYSWMGCLVYLVLMAILIGIVHDAVMKETFIFNLHPIRMLF